MLGGMQSKKKVTADMMLLFVWVMQICVFQIRSILIFKIKAKIKPKKEEFI